MTNTAIILSAGSGSRMGSPMPKQYLPLCGKPVIYYSLRAFNECDVIDEIILVVGSAEDKAKCIDEIITPCGFGKVSDVVLGGSERYESVWKGLCHINDGIENTSRTCLPNYVLIHDGARCLVDSNTIGRTLSDAMIHKAAVASVPVKDTVKRVDDNGFSAETLNRRILRQIQTPQTFAYDTVYGAYARLMQSHPIPPVTDDAMVVELMTDTKVFLSEGNYNNIKITTPEDMPVAEAILTHHCDA